MANGTDMVLMRMGDEDRLDPVAPCLQPGDVGKDQIDTGGAVHIRKGDAQIHNDQAFLILPAISVHITVHSDLTCPAQGQIDQTLSTHVWPFSLL